MAGKGNNDGRRVSYNIIIQLHQTYILQYAYGDVPLCNQLK